MKAPAAPGRRHCCLHHRHRSLHPPGLDKYENEDLIANALPHDIWFHVDALSSAHVYLRLPEGACMPGGRACTLAACRTVQQALL